MAKLAAVIEMAPDKDGVYRPIKEHKPSSSSKHVVRQQAQRAPRTFFEGFAAGMRVIALSQRRLNALIENLLGDVL